MSVFDDKVVAKGDNTAKFEVALKEYYCLF